MPKQNDRSVHHEVFTLERRLKHAPELVFSVWADPAAKRRWFVDSDDPGWKTQKFEMDFREGGTETGEFRSPSDQVYRNDTIYLDIVPNERIISAYTMSMDGRHISASLSTVLFVPSGDGTLLTYTEQGAYLDGLDKAASRESGWAFLLDQMTAQMAAM